MRIGMIGLGVIAPFYRAALDVVEGAQLTAICDKNPARLAPFRSIGVLEFTDYQKMLESGEVDAVLINAPNDQHFPIAKAALHAGKHVCCEKPLTNSLAEALEISNLAKEMQRSLFTAFHRRYNRNLCERLGQLSNPAEIASVSIDYLELIEEHAGPDSWYFDPQRCGGGCIADNGPNAFDSLRTFLSPLTIKETRTVRHKGVEVEASLSLLSAEGIPVQVFLDWRYEHGEKKQIDVVLKKGQTIHVDFLSGFPEFKGSLWHEYEGVLQDFIKHAATGQSNSTHGCEAVRLVEEAYANEVAQ